MPETMTTLRDMDRQLDELDTAMESMRLIFEMITPADNTTEEDVMSAQR